MSATVDDWTDILRAIRPVGTAVSALATLDTDEARWVGHVLLAVVASCQGHDRPRLHRLATVAVGGA